MCIRLKLGNGSMNLAFTPGFKHYTHRLDILRDCTNIVFISSRSNICPRLVPIAIFLVGFGFLVL